MSKRRLGMLSTFILCASVGLVATAQEPMMPKPGPEHEELGFFVGKWSFEGESKESPMGQGGKVSFTESCEWFGGHFALVCRSEGTTPTGPTEALGIMSYDSEKGAYTYYGVEGGMPPFMATGQLDGKTWRYKSESTMGGKTMMTRVTITEASESSYTFQMEMSTDGETWTPVMEGKATKTST